MTFTRAIETLFNHLSTWRTQDVRESGIELSLRAYSPSDLAGMDHNARWKRLCNEGSHDLQDLKFEKSYLRLVAANENASSQQELLPELSIVTKLELQNTRHFWPATACLIASKLPRLVSIDFCLWDSEKKDLPLRLRARSGFIKGIPSLPPSARQFTLSYGYSPPSLETYSPPNIIPAGEDDALSTSLRIFSQQLTSLYLSSLVVASEFFWPLDSDLTPGNAPHWPNLTSLRIEYCAVTPYGEWLFERDPDDEIESDSDRSWDVSEFMSEPQLRAREDWATDHFRVIPNARLMNDFYLAAGHAAAKMPRLKEMALVAINPDREHTLAFTVADTLASLTIRSKPIFKLEANVLDVWKEAARERTGAELAVHFLLPDMFEEWLNK
ncbi:hypothetical protein OIDMADRAFT_137588 [Oidiodendron maius Zn]|uniref:DUF6546 domain-containing protein n=1 Tax=Oidiodendron maius (strain Zn) TaxID=913774 RepID=A0A0C3CV99_OIDMZ|nr:hypothetical protein OIDMADRAFT_137588 [Oidiodendron maius Zn]